MTLTHFIKDLLFTNDKLIIPGFGGFVAQYTPAQFIAEKNIIAPPGKHFIFDATIADDDAIFTDYIRKKTSVSFNEAIKAVKEMVDDFHKKLKEGNTLFIEDVGYFLLDDNNIIRFKRDEEKNYNTESFGLYPISYKAPVQHTIIDEPEESVKRRIPLKKILWFFLALNVIGALTAIVYWKFDNITAYFKHFSAPKNVSAPIDNIVDTVRKQDTTELGQYIDTTTNIKNALRYEEKPKYDSIVTNRNYAAKYYIIAGSFQSFKKAELHSKLLKKQGFNPEIIEFSQAIYRVSVGEFKSKEEALSQLDLLKGKKGAESAWLLLK